MAGAGDAASKKAVHSGFEQLEGELEASIVFAAAGREAYQSGNREQGDACFSDARACYARFIEDVSKFDLDSENLLQLNAKVLYLRQLLERLAISRHRHEAA